MPHKYRHRPTEVEAIQFDPNRVDELRDWLMAEIGTGQFALTASHLLIETEEGDRDCPPGYWVVKGTAGEFYPVRDDVFRNVYDRVVIEAQCKQCGRGVYPCDCGCGGSVGHLPTCGRRHGAPQFRVDLMDGV